MGLEVREGRTFSSMGLEVREGGIFSSMGLEVREGRTFSSIVLAVCEGGNFYKRNIPFLSCFTCFIAGSNVSAQFNVSLS